MLRAALTTAAVTALMLVPAPANAATVDYVVDGDTIRLRSGVYVRLIGIDTPEVGECGYRAAKRKLDRWVGGEPGWSTRRVWTTGTTTAGCSATSTTRGVTPAWA